MDEAARFAERSERSAQQPRTAAGRKLMADKYPAGEIRIGHDSMLRGILAIEAEAAQQRGGLDVEQLARLAWEAAEDAADFDDFLRRIQVAAPQPSAEPERTVPPADPEQER